MMRCNLISEVRAQTEVPIVPMTYIIRSIKSATKVSRSGAPKSARMA